MAGAGERDDEVLFCDVDPDGNDFYTGGSKSALYVWRIAQEPALGQMKTVSRFLQRH